LPEALGERGDPRMVQGGEHLGFALEAREAFGIAGERAGQDFGGQSRLSLVSVARYTAPDPEGTPTFADLPGDAIVRDRCWWVLVGVGGCWWVLVGRSREFIMLP
jgi:hypothetical protein